MTQRNYLNIVFLFATFALAAFALWTVIPLSYTTFKGVNECPSIAGIPACYIVTIGYLAVAFSCLLKRKLLFFIGWSPVFLLATIGSTAELFGFDICPRSETNTPMCYYSLAFSLLIFGTFYGWAKAYSDKGKANES
ncbi:MAG: hypothetical protein ACI92G_001612 [Candidatus Pelagisphaera sp.]|jgi:hypothetical protein